MILQQPALIDFDINNKDHLEEFKYFSQNQRWKTSCKFRVEHPFESVPGMIRAKIINNFLGV